MPGRRISPAVIALWRSAQVISEEVPLTDPFDYDAIQEIVRQAQVRRSREWGVAWRRALRAMHLGCAASLIVFRSRLLNGGATRRPPHRPLAKARR
jgi:hypothetical protein